MQRYPASKKLHLLLSLIFNLGLLATFKYTSFLWNGCVVPLGSMFFGQNFTTMDATIPPVGISFFTFQTMSYSLDIYRGKLVPCRSPLVFATYVSCFPQLVAGPIVRAKELLHQLDGCSRASWEELSGGSQRFMRGFLKKTCLADPLALIYVDPIFQNPASSSPEQMALATLAYGFQIYYDFSGYSDMAIGLGRMMGLSFPENFNHPYRATSFSDFWTRWHVSLSSWLRDYLYIPLGGNRSGPYQTCLNLMITMLLGGLWHGASWLFVIWGACHGLLLVLQRLLSSYFPKSILNLLPKALLTPLLTLLVFSLTLLVWVPFRAQHLDDVFVFWQACLQWKSGPMLDVLGLRPMDSLLLLVALGFHFFPPLLDKILPWSKWPLEFKAFGFGAVMFLLLSFYPDSGELAPFIYFQF
jgi:D-alanyl-lipoteichoic acid acyltransferase DltB (MBOAT superfamily)